MGDSPAAAPTPPAEVTFPGLLGAALRAYSSAMAAELDRAGFADMPRTGYRVVGGLARGSSSLQDLAGRLAMSKQAAAQLVDVLVARGYCARATDPADRRRVVLGLTGRGWGAARAMAAAIRAVDQTLAVEVGAADLAAARAVLTALADLGRAPWWPDAATTAGSTRQ
jgi:DNA-binding MarR family transcriptional regulator